MTAAMRSESADPLRHQRGRHRMELESEPTAGHIRSGLAARFLHSHTGRDTVLSQPRAHPACLFVVLVSLHFSLA